MKTFLFNSSFSSNFRDAMNIFNLLTIFLDLIKVNRKQNKFNLLKLNCFTIIIEVLDISQSELS